MAKVKTYKGVPVPQWYDQELDDWVFYTNEYMKELLSKIESLQEELEGIKSAQTDGSQKVQVSGNIATLYSMNFADRPLYTEITEPTVFVLMNSAMDMWWTDGSADWVVI